MKLLPIILAAGKGTRMHSLRPKVLHTIGSQAMLQHVINSCQTLVASHDDSSHIVVVYGHGGERVKETIANDTLSWVVQAEQKGTGHAVDQARDLIDDDCIAIIAYGDAPLIKAATLQSLIDALHTASLTVLTTVLDDPTGYGRLVRDTQGAIQGITEEKDADAETKKNNRG